MAKQVPVVRPRPKPKSIPEQIGSDIMGGGAELIRQGKVAVEKVKEGARKIKKHLAP